MLADGSVFEGEAIGAVSPGGVAAGEVVFNTVMAGYQEVITDPSYAGQIITFTYPHIGNYGVNATDDESRRPFCRGVIVRELARRHSNHRAEGSLDSLLTRHGVPGIAGIDTRRLTRLIRDTGSMPGAFGTASESELRAAARLRARHRRCRSRHHGDHRRALHGGCSERFPAARRRLRLRYEAQHRSPARPLRHRRGRAGGDACRRRPGAQSRRRLLVERTW